ncbi:uncharacterized protein LAESUDRAFT_54990 [Laetiporus sulphureus 93-53]|uniref:Uncharacterized protein n=1 Tax=Laetiporus sulphureus 93-53 TaxID=1314785 RepID=A0A165FCR7_9APHY|nr:uncharacterized protein LAESUDRAFT_54990 [Laetiporus sulphureus 93-53]KZT08772.1 hypothetical protein LAESUDRAFT_54990 [Laetiporus sulphureus 93-53]
MQQEVTPPRDRTTHAAAATLVLFISIASRYWLVASCLHMVGGVADLCSMYGTVHLEMYERRRVWTALALDNAGPTNLTRFHVHHPCKTLCVSFSPIASYASPDIRISLRIFLAFAHSSFVALRHVRSGRLALARSGLAGSRTGLGCPCQPGRAGVLPRYVRWCDEISVFCVFTRLLVIFPRRTDMLGSCCDHVPTSPLVVPS